MELSDKIYIAGHRGLVGSSIVRQLEARGFSNLITRTHIELDLNNQIKVQKFFSEQKPDYVVLAAAKVGGIHANHTYPAEFIYENIMIEANVINSAYQSGVRRLLFLGSSCIYPKSIQQPMREDALLTGALEQTNEPYSVAKIAGIKLCESYNRQYATDFRSVMPTNLYGINDNFHLEDSHVVPALLRKIHLAKCLEEDNWQLIKYDLDKSPINGIDSNNSRDEIVSILNEYDIHFNTLNSKSSVNVWGSGNAKREFLYVDDMAAASLFVLELDNKIYKDSTQPMLSHFNVGTGADVIIHDLAQTIKDIVGFSGELKFDTTKLEGPSRKLVDVSKLSNLGWNYSIDLKEGLQKTYDWYLNQVSI